ncbi:hypothetical protein Y032_0338g2938 [Ancylostoma ceylanicum]|nr:hypothetical protein Y032_0338g2938 [Ancylostoma ceylanicum]
MGATDGAWNPFEFGGTIIVGVGVLLYLLWQRDVKNVREAKKLKAKFSSSKRKARDDDMAYLRVSSSGSGAVKIRNSETHDNLLKRGEEAQINKIFQVDIRPDALQTLWMCALCHQRSAQDELGDLFGPYYVNMRPEGQWPSFLFKKSLKQSNVCSCVEAHPNGGSVDLNLAADAIDWCDMSSGRDNGDGVVYTSALLLLL